MEHKDTKLAYIATFSLCLWDLLTRTKANNVPVTEFWTAILWYYSN